MKFTTAAISTSMMIILELAARSAWGGCASFLSPTKPLSWSRGYLVWELGESIDLPSFQQKLFRVIGPLVAAGDSPTPGSAADGYRRHSALGAASMEAFEAAEEKKVRDEIETSLARNTRESRLALSEGSTVQLADLDYVAGKKVKKALLLNRSAGRLRLGIRDDLGLQAEQHEWGTTVLQWIARQDALKRDWGAPALMASRLAASYRADKRRPIREVLSLVFQQLRDDGLTPAVGLEELREIHAELLRRMIDGERSLADELAGLPVQRLYPSFHIPVDGGRLRVEVYFHAQDTVPDQATAQRQRASPLDLEVGPDFTVTIAPNPWTVPNAEWPDERILALAQSVAKALAR